MLLDSKKYDDLIRSCDVVLAWAKPSAKLYELRGIAKNAIADFSGAIGDYTQSLALAVEADRARLLRFRGWSNLANEAFRAAAQDFDEAIRLVPTNADAYVGRGLVRARLGRYRDAEVDAAKALEHGDRARDSLFASHAFTPWPPSRSIQRHAAREEMPTAPSYDTRTLR